MFVTMHLFCVIFLCFTSTVTLASKITFDGLTNLMLRLDSENFDTSSVEEKWIEQPLDHNDPHENTTFKMRYFENLDYWKPNGPIYLFIWGEDKAEKEFIASNEKLLMALLAKETNGAMFESEHRYYGNSLPNISKHDAIQYYKYLNTQQALADITLLIRTLKSDPKFKSSPVAVIGGSYAGNLAAWMRMLHPDVVDAAIAVSAPVLAKTDNNEFLDIVHDTFSKYGTENCLQNVEKKFKRYENLLKTSAGIETLKKELNICPEDDLTVLDNQRCLFEHLYFEFKFVAQAGPISLLRGVCEKYSSENNFSLNQVVTGPIIPAYQTLGADTCRSVKYCWMSMSEHFLIIPWIHQYCTEFGYFQTTSSEKQPFVRWTPLESWLKTCEGFVEGDIEKKLDEGVAKTNKLYGGLHPNVTKVVFTHGDMDPWRALGVQQDLVPDAPSIMVNGTTHCQMLIVMPDEPQEMKEKRKHVIELIKKWILK